MKIRTNGDRIRSMDDEHFARIIHQHDTSDFFCRRCQRYAECVELMDNDGDIPDSWCEETILAFLKAPIDEKPGWTIDEKQESGLLEDA